MGIFSRKPKLTPFQQWLKERNARFIEESLIESDGESWPACGVCYGVLGDNPNCGNCNPEHPDNADPAKKIPPAEPVSDPLRQGLLEAKMEVMRVPE